MQVDVTWEEVEKGCKSIATLMMCNSYKPKFIISISRGGTIIGTILSNLLNVDMAVICAKRYVKDECGAVGEYLSNQKIAFYKEIEPGQDILLVDDIYDKGDTINQTCLWLMKQIDCKIEVACLISKVSVDELYHYKNVSPNVWVQFPWDIKE